MPPPVAPVLFRDNIHISEVPATPPISVKAKEKAEDEIELDLESLGLTDKEIKPEKIQKLEKIGSGGFKELVDLNSGSETHVSNVELAVCSLESTMDARLLSQSSEGSLVQVSCAIRVSTIR